ncbi:mannosyl-oligosaccharide alpha-1,2-mannosidase [Lunasporangiospora selenospora]|uniref:alpha-1,2-Mannosidase n=1 Tax=Lunasporangiospora selenospora TaxID=979761 RepID=A0A9P6FY86_9FUNG|nr:mannosyl-oligosaccharide alpha-1,2-mannosidase [Lunasporangiospora selenospora]
MFRRGSQGPTLPRDNNKYHAKGMPRMRLRRKHLVIALSLLTFFYLVIRPRADLPIQEGSVQNSRSGQGQGNREDAAAAAPPPPQPLQAPPGQNVSPGPPANKPNNGAAKKDKKKKKKPPPTLFEFEDTDRHREEARKKKNKNKDKSAQSPEQGQVPPSQQQQQQKVPINDPSGGQDSKIGTPDQGAARPWDVIDQQVDVARKEFSELDAQKSKPTPRPWNVIEKEVDSARKEFEVQDRMPKQAPERPWNVVEKEVDAARNEFSRSEASKGHSGTSGTYPGTVQTKPNSPLWEERKQKVKETFLNAWDSYRRDAWGKDEYHPVGKYGTDMIKGGFGFTIVDSLDTILIMGLEKEFQEAKAWVKDELDFEKDAEVNLFETTIRVLGGLLSAYDLSSKDPVFLQKAVDLADRLMAAFESPTGIPFASVHLKERRGVPSHDGGSSSTAEVSTIQLEFKYLSYLTGDDKYWKAAENVILKMKEMKSLDGLVPIYINPYSGNFYGGEIRLGSRGDSYYEYLIKQYLQTGKKELVYKEMFDHAMAGVKKHLLGRSIPHQLLFVGEISMYDPERLSPKMDHLVCFLGGTMALSSTEGRSLDTSFPRSAFTKLQEEDFKMGEELTESCYEMYHQTETGLAPEIVYWVHKQEQLVGRTMLQHKPGSDIIINDRDAHNLLRPETVESLFYLWRLTGDEKYRHWGWEIFESIEKYTKVSTGGYSSIHDVRSADHIQSRDKTETFFLAETLKYLYLLFGPDYVLPLDKYVFNTEAHALPIFSPPEKWLSRTVSGALHDDEKLKLLIDKEEEEVADIDDESEEHEVMMDDVNTTQPHEVAERKEEMDDEQPTSDDSEPTTNLDEEEEEDPEMSEDEVDQGLENLAIDTGDDEESEVPEVEVDYDDNNGDGEVDEATKVKTGEAEEEEEEEEEEEDGDSDTDVEDGATDEEVPEEDQDPDQNDEDEGDLTEVAEPETGERVL